MGDHVVHSAVQGIEFILNMMNQFFEFNFPGTDIPIGIIMLSPLAVYLVWRVFYSWIFDKGE